MWKVEIDRAAQRDLKKIDYGAARRIANFINGRVAKLDDPRSIGEALTGPRFGHLWKYRVGDYRIIADIQDGLVRIVVVKIGHRGDVYD